MFIIGRSCFVEYDEVVFCEVLESFEVFLVYELVMDVLNVLSNLYNGNVVVWSFFDMLGGLFIVGMEKGKYLMEIYNLLVYVMSVVF